MNIDHLFLKKAAPPWWLVFALIFLSPLSTYAAEPTFASGYPQIDANETKHSSLKLLVQTNETGKAYYVVLADGASAPTDAQVKAGQDNTGADVDPDKKGVLTLTADTEASSYIIGLDPNTAYKIYVVAEDSAETLNTPEVVLVTTEAAPTDTTAPTFDDLGNPITLGETTIDFTVKTDEDGKAYYVVLDDDATVPADSQIKNGQESDNTDVDDTKKGELTLTANTGSVASVTGLTPNLPYDIYVLAEDTEGNVTTGKIDVLLDSIAPEFATDYPKVENVTETTADLKVQTNETGKAYYVVLADGTTAPTDVKNHASKVEVTLTTADTEVSDTISSLTAGTAYDVYVVAEDAAGNIATAGTFPLEFTTTETPATGITGNYDNTGNTITESDTITGTTTITGGTLDGSFDFTASGLDVTLNNVTLAAGTEINGGRLEGEITGDADNPAVLTNVTIGANAILTNVIIGDGVIFEPGVTLTNVRFEGANITLADVTLKGTITVIETSVTIFTNVEFGIGFTALSGGTLSGIIRTVAGFSGAASLTGFTLLDVTEFTTTVDISITDVTFQGSFTTTSTTVVFTNVTFGVNFTSFSGGILSGTIATAAGFEGSGSLTNLTLLDVASFNVASVSVTNVILQGTFTTTSTITLTNVKLATGVVITGTGISLAGTIQPVVATAAISLSNLNIAANSIVLKGIDLGSSVNKGTNVQVFTQTLQTVTGNVNFTGTTQTNINISAGATITGGTLAGAIIGDPVDPPTLNGVTISTGATLSNVILSSTVVLPSTINFGIGVRFTSLSILPFVGFNLTSILPVFTPPVIVGITIPNIVDLSANIIAGRTGGLIGAITPTGTVNVFGSGAQISSRKGRLKIRLSNGGMCKFRPSRVRRFGGRRRSLRAANDNEYGFGNALYITTADDVEIVNQPSVQNLESLTSYLTGKGFTDLEIKDDGNIQVTSSDGKTIIFRPSITSFEYSNGNPESFKNNISFKDSGVVTFVFAEDESGETREQVLYPAPALLDDITDTSVTILTENDQAGGSYPEDGKIKFTFNGKTYEGTLDYYIEKGSSTGASTISVTDESDYFLITYTDGSKQKLFKVSDGTGETSPSNSTTPVQQTDGNTTGTGTTDDGTGTTDDGTDTTDDLKQLTDTVINNTGILEDIALAENSVIEGGILQGKIVGSTNGFAKLDNLEIVANSQVSNVILGKNVTFGTGVILKNVELRGVSLSNVKLEGIIRTSSSATVIKDVLLGATATVIGGKLAGKIEGDSKAPAMLKFLTIEENSQVSNVIISDGVDIPVNAYLGTGVKFTKAENIPVNVDLTKTLSSLKIQIEDVEQPAAINLSEDPVVGGKGLLNNINEQPEFAAQKMDQIDTGNLQLEIEGLTFEVTPVKVKRAFKEAGDGTQSVRLGFANTVIFTTKEGLEIEAYPVVQSITTLKAVLAALQITKFSITEEGNLKVPTLDTRLWISGRAALSSEAAAVEEATGFKFKGDLVVLVFEDSNGNKRQQVLYPAPLSNALIQQAENASLTEEGILSFKLGETIYKGKLDYAVETGQATENYGISEIEDSNGDGVKDFVIISPQGDKQKLFVLPASE